MPAGLGGVTLYGRNVGDASRLSALTASLHAEGDGFVVSLDEEGGDVTRTEVASGSSYPGNGALGAVDDVSLTAAVAASMGSMLAAYGIDLDLAPVVDVNIDPANPVIGIRAFGSDPSPRRPAHRGLRRRAAECRRSSLSQALSRAMATPRPTRTTTCQSYGTTGRPSSGPRCRRSGPVSPQAPARS